jgi:predicted Zn-dependent peptidase
MLAEMKRLRDEDVGPADLKKVGDRVVKSTLDKFADVESISAARANADLYGLGDDAAAKIRDAYLAVTASDVRRAAELYLRPEDAAIVVAGDAARVKAALEKTAPVRIVVPGGRTDAGVADGRLPSAPSLR